MNVFMSGFRGVSSTDKMTIMSNGMDLNVKFENNEIVITEREKPKEEFITVTDGWRGSLKLKECWVTNNVNNGYLVLENVELLARLNHDYIIIDEQGVIVLYKYLKFRPFSPENPPPADWLCEVDAQRRYFDSFYNKEGGIAYYAEGRTSLNSTGCYSTSDYKFLNIEPVED